MSWTAPAPFLLNVAVDYAISPGPRCLRLYALSMRLGLRALARRRYFREALTRVVVPLDPVRYLEFSDTLEQLQARPGERILDLASPKLVAARLATAGASVVSVDAYEGEIEAWRALTQEVTGLDLRVGDGRHLSLPEASFDRAYSISVLEHIPDDGDAAALRELARVVAPGGRVVITLQFDPDGGEDWREKPVYGESASPEGRHFFARWYDDARLDWLVSSVGDELELVGRRVAGIRPKGLARAFVRHMPLSAAVGPFLPLIVRPYDVHAQGVVRLTFVRRRPEAPHAGAWL